ncbi:hypothetical protein CCNA_03990 [Caulobacter vibrioides NA1000]|uniref:Uncharacterized protein n=1 Tax=Caulobacter vibrioides (strain NA1000 / CB15N) TaxID=565050 RepID=A0A0H3IWL9_CAUVN|nr:hypothetical protein [Caulobacter vibrioides]YP_009020562.1 hypothetical protein CCNA_03990 [Caulobacter vibrioides NA1000]AHI88593.1 hypothetical protein CCNA_03990 [Caulobacter vibrioides NA1000]
MSGLERSHGL